MNAKEMFEALGYEYYETKYSILYTANCDMDEDHISIGFGLLSHTFYAKQNCDPYDITIDEFKAIQQQLKELHWLDEKTEIKEARNPEVTNFEHYKDEILEHCVQNLAVVKGRPTLCYKTNCNDCDFKINQIGCREKVKDWLKQPHKKPVYKLTKFEKELLQCYPDINSFKLFNSLNGMKEKGYFKDIDDNEIIGDILAKSEVVG